MPSVNKLVHQHQKTNSPMWTPLVHRRAHETLCCIHIIFSPVQTDWLIKTLDWIISIDLTDGLCSFNSDIRGVHNSFFGFQSPLNVFLTNLVSIIKLRPSFTPQIGHIISDHLARPDMVTKHAERKGKGHAWRLPSHVVACAVNILSAQHVAQQP